VTTVLAIETATREGSVAVADDTGVLAAQGGDGGRPHGARLPGDALDVLAAAGRRLDAIDLLAVCLGPGAFTGLRVGIAAAQGLAFALGRSIVGVTALEALAVAAFDRHPKAAVAGVWMDAARGEVFAARFRRGSEAPAIIDTPVSAPASAVAAVWNAEGGADCWIGDGALRYRPHLAGAVVVEPLPLLAPLIALIALSRRREAGPPHALRPLYVRPSDAELARQP
jgi:tRNA threonylcarbamoyladenosine biosynthesis protein TsaB